MVAISVSPEDTQLPIPGQTPGLCPTFVKSLNRASPTACHAISWPVPFLAAPPARTCHPSHQPRQSGAQATTRNTVRMWSPAERTASKAMACDAFIEADVRGPHHHQTWQTTMTARTAYTASLPAPCHHAHHLDLVHTALPGRASYSRHHP